MKKITGIFALTVLLSACGTSVKVNDAPVMAPMVAAPAQAQTAVASVSVGDDASNANVPMGTRVIYFDYDSFVINPAFLSVLEAHAKYIKADKSRKVSIEGHADERGGSEYNLALGQKRAEAVRRVLVLLGVADTQLEAVSFGKEKPAVLGSNEEAWAKNRRAELSYR